MGGEIEKAVVIQTCIDLSWSEMKWMLNALPINPGDEIIFLGVLQLTNSSTSSFLSAAKLLGYKGKEDPHVNGSMRKFMEDERRKKKEEYSQNCGIIKLQEKLQSEKKVKVKVEVAVCTSRRVGAVRAVKRFGATCMILDREMKKEKQYFMDRVSCGISTMKSNNTIVQLRGPIIRHVSNDEMIPSYSWEHISPTSDQTLHTSSIYSTISTNSTSCSTSKENRTPKNEANGLIHNHHNFVADPICSHCNNQRPRTGSHMEFSYEELDEATGGFSEENFISEGGFGLVFKGRLKDGRKVAVKKLKATSLQGEKEFKSEVHLLSQARHHNVVMLLGSCTQGTHRLLVYEFICNGSLEDNLSGECKPLNWEQRMKIARGAARGLAYLHERSIVHRDMRPGNILITHDYEALLGDFGLAKEDDGTGANSGGVVGTLGYVAPEYAESGKMSDKTDVYSFGVVLLQLITGLRTTDEIPGGKSLVGWAKPFLEAKNYPKLIDSRILECHDVHQLFWMVLAADSCLKQDPHHRFTMKQVLNYLNCNKEGNTNFIIDLE
ncbi:proline-rich receptor-like protein kinase PERK12 isoform X2 [Salvia splendens]|uniref:proline-rich receptor-like protein kinase PERK12 isoform X2 n=1 Tax=Salvia splendens TaxID=180675 RepID=UPI001C27D675|nr:proline-rich receptor-like protein kinase PERK12 isoform X2 [Salvia splendens]